MQELILSDVCSALFIMRGFIVYVLYELILQSVSIAYVRV